MSRWPIKTSVATSSPHKNRWDTYTPRSPPRLGTRLNSVIGRGVRVHKRTPKGLHLATATRLPAVPRVFVDTNYFLWDLDIGPLDMIIFRHDVLDNVYPMFRAFEYLWLLVKAE